MVTRDADDADRVFFGATVDVRDGHGKQRTVSIVGVDEIDTERGYISWMSPMARALTKAREGDTVTAADAWRRRGAGNPRGALRAAGTCGVDAAEIFRL